MKRIYTYTGLLLLCFSSFFMVSCGDDEEGTGTARDLYEIIVDKSVVRIGQNEKDTVTIVLGNENYSVESYNTAIATASVSGDRIAIQSGSQNGATLVKVTDGEGVTADISVNVGIFDLAVNDTIFDIEVGDEDELIVSMGNFSSNDDLTIVVSDETIFSMESTDAYRPFYTLKALKIGTGTITITDQKEKQIVVTVNVTPRSIEVSNIAPRVGVGAKTVVTVEDGNGEYTMTSSDTGIVTVAKTDGSDTEFVLTGVAAGTATITVSDKENETLELTVTVVLADQVADLESDNYLEVPFTYQGVAASDLQDVSTISFEARIYIETLNGSGQAHINTIMGIEKEFLLRVDVHKDGSEDVRYLQLAADNNGSIRYEGSTPINTNTWYNVAVVLDDSKSGSERIALYVNGVAEMLQLSNGTPGDLKNIDLTSNFYIGMSSGSRYLNGAISYARVWTKALTAEEIAAQSGVMIYEEQENLVANWSFTNGNGDTDTFISVDPYGFKAEAHETIATWMKDPILSVE